MRAALFPFNAQPIPNRLHVRKDQKGHVWCGPAALSAALGIATSVAYATIRVATLRRYIKGVSYAEMEHALSTFGSDTPQGGVKFKSARFPREAQDCMTLKRWLKTRDENCTYIVCLTGHWITIRGNQWACNMNLNGRLIDDCPYMGAKVRYAIRLHEKETVS